MTHQEINKRIARNTLMLYLRMLLSMAISLYTSRIVLNALGVEDFGIYNVVGGIVLMLGFLNYAMSASTQRFLTFEMGIGNLTELNRIFNMSLIIHAIIAIIVFILSETIGLWFLNTHLNIPSARIIAANWIYQFSVFAFIITVLYVPYNAIVIAHERMNVFAYISITEVVLKLFVAVILVWFGFDKLKFYAALIFFVSVVISIIYIVYCRMKFEESKFHLLWDKQLFRKMSNFANWNLLGVTAALAYNLGVNFLLNIFFGPIVNAARGVSYQVQGAVNGFVNNFQIAVNPTITKSFAIGDKQYMYSLIFRASKYSFYLLLLISLPLLIETEIILKLWLKTVPDFTIIFTRLILIDVLICSLSGFLQTIAQATGNVRKYQLVVSIILLLNLPFSFILLKLGFVPQVTFVISIILSFGALIARLIVLKRIVLFPAKEFIIEVLSKVILVFIVASIIPFYIFTQIHFLIMQFVLVLIISMLSVISTVWFLGITKYEREHLKFSFLKILTIIRK
jgi:O-antigen/teichoic acid export membrane protein